MRSVRSITKNLIRKAGKQAEGSPWREFPPRSSRRFQPRIDTDFHDWVPPRRARRSRRGWPANRAKWKTKEDSENSHGCFIGSSSRSSSRFSKTLFECIYGIAFKKDGQPNLLKNLSRSEPGGHSMQSCW